MINNKRKICIVSSSGGHLYKAYNLKAWWNKYPHFWITKEDEFSESILAKERKYFAYFPENRNVINAVRNFFLALKILKKEKPSLIFSTGAGIAPPFFLAAKLLMTRTIFMETFVFINKPTLSGKMVYPFADHFFIQNKSLKRIYPKAIFKGSIY